MSDKLEITNEMLASFANMIKSKDSNDCDLAIDILEGRDKSNVQSEANFVKLKELLINNDKFFPSSHYERWEK